MIGRLSSKAGYDALVTEFMRELVFYAHFPVDSCRKGFSRKACHKTQIDAVIEVWIYLIRSNLE